MEDNFISRIRNNVKLNAENLKDRGAGDIIDELNKTNLGLDDGIGLKDSIVTLDEIYGHEDENLSEVSETGKMLVELDK